MDAKERLEFRSYLEEMSRTSEGCLKGVLLTAKKCIEELEETIACLSESNEITKKDRDSKLEIIASRNKVIDKYKQQIDKMKMCCNCAKWGTDEWSDQNEPCKNKCYDGVCSLWEMWEERR